AGYGAVVVLLPLGDITSGQMRAVAGLVRSHANGTPRTTNDQNLVLPSVPAAALPAVHAALVGMGLGNADAGTLVDVVSCPGMGYCPLASTRAMGVAAPIPAHLWAPRPRGHRPPRSLGHRRRQRRAAVLLGPRGRIGGGRQGSCGPTA